MKLFTAEEEKYLSNLLSRMPEDAPVAYLEELHGFLFGLAMTPEMIPVDEWLPLIIIEEANIEDERELEDIARHLLAVYDRLYHDSLKGKLVFPFDYDRMKDEDFNMVQDWAYGLFMAISFRPRIWAMSDEEIDEETFNQLPEETQSVLDAFSAIAAIAMPEQMEGAFKNIIEEEDISKDELLGAFLGELPFNVEILINHSAGIRKNKAGSEAPAARESAQKSKKGRNDLCPCGSGRKYKKCCGAN